MSETSLSKGRILDILHAKSYPVRVDSNGDIFINRDSHTIRIVWKSEDPDYLYMHLGFSFTDKNKVGELELHRQANRVSRMVPFVKCAFGNAYEGKLYFSADVQTFTSAERFEERIDEYLDNLSGAVALIGEYVESM